MPTICCWAAGAEGASRRVHARALLQPNTCLEFEALASAAALLSTAAGPGANPRLFALQLFGSSTTRNAAPQLAASCMHMWVARAPVLSLWTSLCARRSAMNAQVSTAGTRENTWRQASLCAP